MNSSICLTTMSLQVYMNSIISCDYKSHHLPSVKGHLSLSSCIFFMNYKLYIYKYSENLPHHLRVDYWPPYGSIGKHVDGTVERPLDTFCSQEQQNVCLRINLYVFKLAVTTIVFILKLQPHSSLLKTDG